MEEQTLEIPPASKPPTTEDVVGSVVSSKTQSKNRKRKASSSKSGSSPIKTDKLRPPNRRRNGSSSNTTAEAVVGGGVSSKTQSKNRRRKAAASTSKSSILIKTDKLRFPTRLRNGGSPARNLTCPTSSTYREKIGLPLAALQGPTAANKRKDGELNVGERDNVVQWILATCKFEMLDDMTAIGAVDIVDRFLSTRLVSMKYYEADYVGVAALLIAMKYYESQAFRTPSLDELIGYAFEDDPNRLHRNRARIMERQILAALQWEIDVPTVYTFLIQFLEAAESRVTFTVMEMALFYAKMGMWRNHIMVKMLPPQMLAAAALEAACAYTGDKFPGSTGFDNGFKRIQLLKCSRWMLKLHLYGHVNLHFCWWVPF